MQWDVFLPLLCPLLAALLARPLSNRMEPRAATWALTASAVLLAAASWVALAVLAADGLARIPLVADLGHWSSAMVQHHDPVSLTVAAASGLLLAAAIVAAVRMLWRRLRAVLAAGLDAACMPGPDELAVMEDPAPDAYAIPGLPGRIVVSTGMLGSLDTTERGILLAHERAHLAAQHYLFVAVAQLGATANPFLRPLATAVTYTVERWADEHAATVCGDRHRVARTVGKAALATKHAPTRRRIPAAALGMIGRRNALKAAGPVPRRVAALLAPAPRLRPLLLIAIATILVIAGLSALDAALDLHLLLKMAGAR